MAGNLATLLRWAGLRGGRTRRKTLSESRIVAVIANYDFSDNADRLKAQLAPHLPTLLFDNSSPVEPRTVDRVLPNEHYTGQWNAAVKEALDRGCCWLLFVASDIQLLTDPADFAECMTDAINDPRVGIYTPSLRPDSRAAFPFCFHLGTGSIRQCYMAEGFFFLARTEILKSLYPIDLRENLYGWAVDQRTAYEAYQQGRQVVVDDRVQIFHPKSVHDIPHGEAGRQAKSMLTPPVLRFSSRAQRKARHAERRLRRRYKLRQAFARLSNRRH